jgi:hypothetical protein
VPATLRINLFKALELLSLVERETVQQCGQSLKQIIAHLLDNAHICQEKTNHDCHETINSAAECESSVCKGITRKSYLKTLFSVISVNLVMGVTQKLFKAVAAAWLGQVVPPNATSSAALK